MVIGEEERQRHITGLFTLRAHSGAAGFSRLGQSLRSFPRLPHPHWGGRPLLRKALICPPKRRKQPERYAT
jgi:hypothetical protein